MYITTYLHRHFVKCLLHPHGNIDQIFCKNANDIFQIENSENFKTDFFFVKPILANIPCRTSLQKITSSMGCIYDNYIEILAYTMLQICIIFAKLHIKNVLEYVELYVV